MIIIFEIAWFMFSCSDCFDKLVSFLLYWYRVSIPKHVRISTFQSLVNYVWPQKSNYLFFFLNWRKFMSSKVKILETSFCDYGWLTFWIHDWEISRKLVSCYVMSCVTNAVWVSEILTLEFVLVASTCRCGAKGRLLVWLHLSNTTS